MRMNIRLILVLALTLFTKSALADQAHSDHPAKPEVEIEASLIAHGSEDWSVHITRTGIAYFRHSYKKSFGTLRGDFFLDADILLQLLTEAQIHQFNDLPRKIQPALIPIHAPMYAIDIRVDGNRHKVQVYHPAGFGQSSELDRFSAVWDAIWKEFPLKPPGVLNIDSSFDQKQPIASDRNAPHVKCP